MICLPLKRKIIKTGNVNPIKSISSMVNAMKKPIIIIYHYHPCQTYGNEIILGTSIHLVEKDMVVVYYKGFESSLLSDLLLYVLIQTVYHSQRNNRS